VHEHLIHGETATDKLGAKSLMEQPASQLSSQNKALVPSPTSTETEALKNACAARSSGNRNFAYILSGSVRASQTADKGPSQKCRGLVGLGRQNG
jgi:hypothetical protein